MKGQEKHGFVYTNCGEVPTKLKTNGFQATSLSTHDFSTLFTILPNILIERNFQRTSFLACNDMKAVFASTDHIY